MSALCTPSTHPPIHTANSGGRGYNNDLQTPARARRRLGAAPDCGWTRRPAEPMMIKSSWVVRELSFLPARLRAPTAWPNDLPPRSCRVCNTHQAPAEGVKCHQCRHSSLAFETLPAETYMYLLGLSLKSLAYFTCLPCVPFSPPFLLWRDLFQLSAARARRLHAYCMLLRRGIGERNSVVGVHNVGISVRRA